LLRYGIQNDYWVTYIDSINSLPYIGNWTQVGLDIDGEAANDQSGYSVAMSADGKTIAIGALFNDGNGNNAGHVRVSTFNSTSGNWTQVGLDIDGEDLFDNSGLSVAMSADGKTVVIGARFSSGSGRLDCGHARVYSINSTSGNWTQVGLDIDGEAAGDQSGSSVAMSADGKTIAIGSISNAGNGNNAGHVRVYSFNPTSGNWTQVGLDIDGEGACDPFGCVLSGWSVAMSTNGNTIAIGARSNDGNGINAGHVRVYSFNSTSGNWTQVGLDVDGEAANDQSGYSVAMSADGKTIAIGAPYNGANGLNAGHVRVLSINSTSRNWTQVGLDIDGEAACDQPGLCDESGWSVAMSADGKTIAAGAPFNGGNGNNAGHVRVYAISSISGNWTQVGLDIDGEAINDRSGYSIAMSADGKTIVVGAPFNDGNGNNAGHVRVYKYETAPTRSPTKTPTKVPTRTPTKTPTTSTNAPESTTTECPNDCGLFGLNFFCPRRGNCNCGFIRRLFHWNGC
jgi:FG-GAP repeat